MVLALFLWAERAQRLGIPFPGDSLLLRHSWLFSLVLVWLVLASVNDLYDLRVASELGLSSWAILRTTAEVWLIYFLVYFFSPPNSLPRIVVLFYGLISFLLICLWRAFYIYFFRHPSFRQKALIIGAGWAGRTIARAIQDNLSMDYHLVGYIDDDPAKEGQVVEGIPVLGGRSALLPLIEKEGISEVIVSITHDMAGELFQTIMDCSERGVQITPMPILYEQATGRVAVEHVGDNWSIALPLNGSYGLSPFLWIKRGVDIVVSLLGLLLFFPTFPFLALAIRLDSQGPIFYIQERLGKAGRPFRLIKLRSMFHDAEEDGPRWTEEYDRRVTRVGRFLRRSRLDEVPQLLNVLRGEMSLIGPRPERPEFVAQLQEQIPFYRARLAVRPGLTGWAQVKYHYANSVEDALIKLQYDLYYIKHQSFHLDLLIFLKTIGVVLTFRGT